MHPLLVTNKGGSAFSSANHFQGQLHTPQSVAVPGSNLDPVIEAWAYSGLPEPLERNAEEDRVGNRCKLDLDMNGLLLETI
jgi:hypothetical protein